MRKGTSNVNIPSKETVEYGRRVVQQQLDLLDRWLVETNTSAESDEARIKRLAFTRYFLQHKLTGYDSDGCVIVPFDKRWLDDDFRAMMEPVYASVEDGR